MKIKFTAVNQQGQLNLNPGYSIMMLAFSIGTLANTRKHNPETHSDQYQTDIEGLKAARSQTAHAIEVLSGYCKTMGLVQGNIDTNEVDVDTLKEYGLIQAGLSEMAEALAYELGEMDCLISKTQGGKP